ncbi:hypothetical protein [Paenibacillus tianjinensis]|uniref:Uncharacterized protein n=1 Tax=Paenibacillus tianjinensis TaxID=2810347 RepID=A0ABX7L5C0_9BACL|nr:hypothetical protein [Paenibacillus tianjinensis]QSF43260.1 hypothetical protein JRJ22_18510 [Paenibacillus tianjinensis]
MSTSLQILNELQFEFEDLTGYMDKVYTRLNDECVIALQYLGFDNSYFDDCEYEDESGVFIDLAPAAMQFYGLWSREENKFRLLADIIQDKYNKENNY